MGQVSRYRCGGTEAIATDSTGNTYVTGFIYGGATFGSQNVGGAGWYDAFLAKINTSGDWVWAKSVGGSSGDFGRGVALDAQGNVYWTGDFVGSVNMGSTSLVSNGGGDLNGGGEIFVAKLDADGNYVWAVSGGSSDSDQPYDIFADDDGNAYIAARVRGTPTFGDLSIEYQGGNDGVVAKINNSGEWEWARSIGSAGGDISTGITLNDHNNVLVTGSVDGLGYINGQVPIGEVGETSAYVVELTTDGAYLDYKTFEGISISDIYTNGLGDTLIGGTIAGDTQYFGGSYQTSGSSDLFVALYSFPSFTSNQAPTDLNSTTELTIAENQPAGTIVGEFNATDPEGG